MAIIGKSVQERRDLLEMADALSSFLKDPKSVKQGLIELDDAENVIAQKEAVLKDIAKAEKLAVKNQADSDENESQRINMAKILNDFIDTQKTFNDRKTELDKQIKVIAQQQKDAEKAVANADTLEEQAKTKNDIAAKLISDTEALKIELNSAVVAYKNKLSILDKVA